MDTDDLIKALASDTKPAQPSLSTAWTFAVLAAIAGAAIVFMIALGPRADFAAVLGTWRFEFKFVVTLALALCALLAVRALSRPGADTGAALTLLLLPAVLLLAGSASELLLLPSSQWMERMAGKNGLQCLTFIPLIALAPLAAFLLTLRHGAPDHPALGGAVAGLAAGGLAAAFYASHCTDDSPLFVTLWYCTAIAGLGLAGALAAHLTARW
ncbi:MAG: DUF1109 family protein [Alphaproteobacteria bacterium]|nr:DUF1109 family protein [Alphaproteobacteria bacterium]